ncbi:MAG TPA: diacylglycerol kinase family protein [Acidimicrobiia bacterium]
MGRVAWDRRAAAIVTLPLFGLAMTFTVVVLFRNPGTLVFGFVGVTLLAWAAWWLVTETSILRVTAGVLALTGLVFVALSFSVATSRVIDAAWRTALVLVMVVTAVRLAQYSLRRPIPDHASDARTRPRRPQQPVLLCNPWSGGGKVEKFGLIDLAAELGIETVMLAEGLDLEELTRDAVARGADCLGMAGGDGSQALVASVAVEHGIPFVCIPAGTRNHFALDLGLDRDDPRAAMRAFRDAVERSVDFGTVNDRLFVNNVSLGIYATIVQSNDYRDAKVDTSLAMAAELLGHKAESFDLQYTTPSGRHVDGAFLIMVSNNPYVMGARFDAAQRRWMDSGELGVFAISTKTATQAARLMSLAAIGIPDISSHWSEFTTEQFEVLSRSGRAYIGVDGEALDAETPLRFRIHPLGLRLLVPEGNLEIAERRRARDIQVAHVASVARGREPRVSMRPAEDRREPAQHTPTGIATPSESEKGSRENFVRSPRTPET